MNVEEEDRRRDVRILARIVGELGLDRDAAWAKVTELQERGKTFLEEERKLRASLADLRSWPTPRPLGWCVARFFDAMGLNRHGAPPEKVSPSVDTKLGLHLCVEELCELLEAAGLTNADQVRQLADVMIDVDFREENIDLPKLIDAVADLKYVAEGIAVRMGVDMVPIDAAVHEANMRKAGGPKDPKTGKQLKPPGWKAPDIERLLMEQGLKR